MKRFAGGRPWQGDAPRIPEGMCVFAVGDIHGRLDLLEDMLAHLKARIKVQRAAGRNCQAVFLGDYIDRGSDSRGVVGRLCERPLPDVECRFLLGNHEAAMLAFMHDPASSPWLHFGGAEAAASYGVRVSVATGDKVRRKAVRDALAEAVPARHLGFFKALESMVVVGDYAFVHAGIRPGRPLDRQRKADLLSIREPFLSWQGRHEKMIVHGHTICEAPECLENRIGIDTGAYATGCLTALELFGNEYVLMQSGA